MIYLTNILSLFIGALAYHYVYQYRLKSKYTLSFEDREAMVKRAQQNAIEQRKAKAAKNITTVMRIETDEQGRII